MENNNDDNNKKIKTLLRLFPYLPNKNLAEKLKIDDESIHYISIREFAEKISKIIKTHLEKLEIDKNIAIITDATAGVGGDTISFAMNFFHVNAIELNKQRAEYLENNINIYGLKNVQIYNDNCTNLLYKIDKHHVIFLDPPWENEETGSYKQYKQLTLIIDNFPLETYCNKLMDTKYMKKVPELIVIKLPKNYDLIHFYKKINNKNIYYYDLNKMIILVIIT